MARITNSNTSSSNYYRRSTSMASDENESVQRPASAPSRGGIRASAYVVDAATGALNGYHYSSTLATGVGSGIPSPPQSPPLAATYTARRDQRRSNDQGKVGAARTITEECERLFCEDLKDVFLGEGRIPAGSLVVGAPFVMSTNANTSTNMPAGSMTSTTSSMSSDTSLHMQQRYRDGIRTAYDGSAEMTPPSEQMLRASLSSSKALSNKSLVQEWIEVWDYSGGSLFRGYTATPSHDPSHTSLVIFFDAAVIGKELKHGLMALIELATMPDFACTELLVCISRDTAPAEAQAQVRDLGWVGFEAHTLACWTGNGEPVTSAKWFFMRMDV